MLMPVNWRGKLPSYDAKDAGNYEGALLFTNRDYENPIDIRATLQSGESLKKTGGLPVYDRKTVRENISGKSDNLPGCCETMRMRIGMVTSWCFSCFDEIDTKSLTQSLREAGLEEEVQEVS